MLSTDFLQKCLTGSLLFLLAGTVYAEAGFGICDFGKETLPSIVCNGPSFLKETTVSGNVRITGKMEAHDVDAGAIDITGSVSMFDSTVRGNAQVTGTLDAKNVQFMKSVNVTGDNVLLNRSTIRGELYINSNAGKPRLKLICSSSIAGSVNFGDKEGLVQVTGGSMVKGKIINGTIEFLEEECPE